jgi:hypothetical protein
MERRNFIQSAGVSLGAVVLPSVALGSNTTAGSTREGKLHHFNSIHGLKSTSVAKEGDWIQTLGFHAPGDGGTALYQVHKASKDIESNEADVISLKKGLIAVLKESQSVNYRMFGARGDGESDDGVQIKMAHDYANRHQIPVVNLSGEFWIKHANNIPITTPVQWGKTIFHIDERYNKRGIPRIVVLNDRPSIDLTGDENLKKVLVDNLKPGVQIIPELAPWTGHLMVVLDDNDRIGIRAGYENNRGWAREELFYVEEEGRIVGDIAWEFSDLTSITAIHCNDNYLVIEGGCFYMSGDSPEGSTPGYHQNGFSIQRSRTIIREQWMGLEPGKRDMSLEPRSGFYSLSRVYDVTLENIRAMPWEKSRRPPEPQVEHGTYGISGARMLNCNFLGLTAEGGWVAWGVFGTNLNKNFRLENCRLNRVDIHFHCWNLYINNCFIGFKGITVTGGGDLFVNDTTRYGNNFISFRQDYGAKWDGPIRLRGCTLKPSGNGRATILSMHPRDFDYKYPISFGTSIAIEDMCIDYAAAPASTQPCWMMDITPLSMNNHGHRLLFPQQMIFKNIMVTGREQGIRLIRIPNPQFYDLRRIGGDEEGWMRSNFTMICENVHLDKTTPDRPDDSEHVHLLIGGEKAADYIDNRALYPKIVFIDCDNVALYLNQCAANVHLERCSVNTVTASGVLGEINFSNCRLQPNVRTANGFFYSLDSSLGVRFTNCTVHAPVVDGKVAPHLFEQISFLKINKSLQHCHLNTSLGPEVLSHLKGKGIALNRAFIGKLRTQHALDG